MMDVYQICPVKVEVTRTYTVYTLIPVDRMKDEEYITDEAKRLIMRYDDDVLTETAETHMLRRTDIDIINIGG